MYKKDRKDPVIGRGALIATPVMMGALTVVAAGYTLRPGPARPLPNHPVQISTMASTEHSPTERLSPPVMRSSGVNARPSIPMVSILNAQNDRRAPTAEKRQNAGRIQRPSREPVLGSAAANDPAGGAENPTTVTLSPEAGLALAQRLFDSGEIDRAAIILRELRKADPADVDQTQIAFLLGMVAFHREDYEAAVEAFRSILDDQPELVRVRLELARSLFALKRDRVAAYHFRLALAADLPDEAKANIKIFLGLIETRKSWRVNASAGIAPDTNVSAGPRDRTVEIFGLPFELDDNARQRSGIGLTTSLSAEYFPRLTDKWRLETRAGGSFTDYSNIRFDDLFLFAEAGPRFEKRGFSFSALAAYSRRFFGGDGFSESIGGKALVGLGLTSRTRVFLRASAAQVEYDFNAFRNGPVYSTGASVSHALSRGRFLRGGATFTREQTRDQVLRNTQAVFNASYSRELPYALTAQIGPEFYIRQFDNFDPLNENTRLDLTYGGSLFLTKRDWRLYGFAPVMNYQFLRNESNTSRFEFTRHRLNLSLTRVF